MTARDGQLKKTAKHSAIYAVGSILRHITGFVMLPIYTRYLTPADYGAVELLSMAIEITGILIGLRITQALFRFYILAEGKKRKNEIASTVLIIVIVTSTIGSTLLFFAAGPLSKLIFGDTSYLYEFQLFAFTLIANAISAVGLAYIRARQLPIIFVSIGAATLVMQVVLNLIFVVALDLHVRGVVYSSLCSGFIVAIGLGLYVFGGAGIHYSRVVAGRLLSFIAPLILASVGAFYVAYADKYFLRLFGGLADVGLYALAGRLSSILGTFYESFNSSWSADRYEIVKHENANELFNQVFRFLSAAIVLVGVGLALFAGDFIHIMTKPEYYSAAGIVPLFVAAGIASIYKVFCNFGILFKEQTRHIAEAAWIKVVVATGGYLLLIPYVGIYGAAVTLFLSNLIEFYWINKHATRAYDMKLQWGSVYLLIILGVLFVATGRFMPVGEISWFGIRIILYGVFIYMVYKLPMWNESDRKIMKAGVNKVSCLITGVRVN